MKYIIVGGVAGGATAAARLRRIDEYAEIILFEKGQYISYANCGLPYYIGGEIKDRDKLFVQTPEAFARRFAVSVRVQEEVIALNPAAHTVEVRQADGSTYSETYDKLLLSPGATPFVPNIPGIDATGVFTLRNVENTDAIKHFIDTHLPKTAVVVGGGFIGLEMAENLHTLGIQVSIVELAPQVMAPIDYSMACFVHAHLVDKGVGLYLNSGLQSITTLPSGTKKLSLSTEDELQADLIILSIGVRPLVTLAQNAGLALGERGGIQVDEYLRTSEPDIYAVGDAIEYIHPITQKPWLNYLAGPANRQARLVADNMAGIGTVAYEGAIGTSIAKVFDLVVATTGLPAKALKQQGLAYRSATLHPMSHASYYPGAHPLTLKITFDEQTGRLYGAQAVGHEGVDKRIDAIAQIIKQGGGLNELMSTEQAYAPPFSSAKDPIALAGYIANNIKTGKVNPMYWRDIETLDLDVNDLLVDVRSAEEYELGHIPGSINISVDELRERLSELDPNKRIVLYCQVGLRGYLASNILRQRGYGKVYNLVGGYKLWFTASRSYQSVPPRSPQGCGDTPRLEAPGQECVEVDASGLCCPGPIVTLRKAVDELHEGQRLRIFATDPGFVRDAEAWCQSTGNCFVEGGSRENDHYAIIEKTKPQQATTKGNSETAGKGKTFILFSDDLDKALATFVLANGAAATGQKVTIFFTFWGLNAIRRAGIIPPPKDIWGKLFGMMLPKDSTGLGLSKMNMGGIGAWMMRRVMRERGVASLEQMRDQALESGVEFIACQMSMDVMGITREELIPEVGIGGVATYMQRAEESNVNLFI